MIYVRDRGCIFHFHLLTMSEPIMENESLAPRGKYQSALPGLWTHCV